MKLITIIHTAVVVSINVLVQLLMNIIIKLMNIVHKHTDNTISETIEHLYIFDFV